MFSITGYKQFQRCQLQWYFKNIVADARVKNDPYRKEVTILSKLDSIEAWRGKIVDDVISRLLVNAINNKYPIKKSYYIDEASKIFDSQLEYAIFQKYREPGRRISKDVDFAALLDYELGGQVPDEAIERAKADIHEALNNLLDDLEFLEYLKSASFLMSQRRLTYNFDRFNVVAIPDLILFFNDKPPHIIDWKVHTYGLNSYDEQLISYAVALFKVAESKPHKDFPSHLSKFKIYDYKLSEYQLLHKDRIRRDYQVTPERIEEIGEKISRGILQMYMSGCDKKFDELDPENFESTTYFENCRQCGFKKICKVSDDEKLRNRHLQN